MNTTTTRRTTRRRGIAAAAAIAVTTLAAVPAAVATAAAPYCGIYWGSLTKQDTDHPSAHSTNLRAGRHDCFDRLVIDLGPPVSGLPGPQDAGYSVRYVTQFVDDPSGEPVPLAGGAFLQITVNARAITDDYVPTYSPGDPDHAVSGFRTFRQVIFRGTHEALTQIGLGVRARLPFRVFQLAGPGSGSRLVIDVAHQW